MSDLGPTISDLQEAFGDKGTASEVMRKERSLSLNMVRVLSDQLSLPADLLTQLHS
jgi:antitoxin component HigA of HigAB toxin-antitoxin module